MAWCGSAKTGKMFFSVVGVEIQWGLSGKVL